MTMSHYSGGCHCGAVRFEVDTDIQAAIACNCSICQKSGTILTFAPAAAFRLIQGADSLTDYTFASGNIHHLFCKVCGVRSFGRGSGPDGTEMIAVNVRCLDGVEAEKLSPKPYDGRSL